MGEKEGRDKRLDGTPVCTTSQIERERSIHFWLAFYFICGDSSLRF